MKTLLTLICLHVGATLFAQQKPDQIILSRDQYKPFKMKERYQIRILTETGEIAYRKNPRRKFRVIAAKPDVRLFTDSLDYQQLKKAILSPDCDFTNKGSLRITLIYGKRYLGATEIVEFGRIANCPDAAETQLFKRIYHNYFMLWDLVTGKH